MKQIIIASLSAVVVSLALINLSSTDQKTYLSVSERNNQPYNSAKGAMEYLHRLKSNSDGVIPVDAVLNARNAVNAHRAQRSSSSLTWQEMGPDNVGGRTRAILIDKDDSNILYAGGVSGGLWKSTNSGYSWNIIEGTDQLEFSGVVSICQTTNGDIYFGTGEGSTSNLGGTSNGSTALIGGGIYKSTDGGNSFEQLPSTSPSNFISTDFKFAAVTEIAAHNSDPNTLYAATNGGLQLSTDGGDTWSTEVPGEFFDVEVASDNSVFASKVSSIYFSNNGQSGTFNTLDDVAFTFGLSSYGRIEIAVAPSDPDYVYAAYSNQWGLGRYKGIYRSTNKGQDWDLILPGWDGNTPPDYNIFNEQPNYSMALAVDPLNKDRIIIGGLDLWSFEYGVSIEPISFWAIDPEYSWYVHADQHEIVFDKTNPNRFYVGNDGGVFRTDNNGQEFSALNRGYSVTQFYTIDYTKDGKAIGGTQDNGTQYIDFSNPVSIKAAFKATGGDGGHTQISYIDPDAVFAQSQNGDARRSEDGGENFGFIDGFLGNDMAGQRQSAVDEGDEGLFATFINPMYLWESVSEDGTPLDTSMFFAANAAVTSTGTPEYCVYMTKGALDFEYTPTWFQVTPGYTSPIERIATTSDGNHLFFSRGSALYRTDNLSLDTVPDTEEYLDVDNDDDNLVVTTTAINSSDFDFTITDIAVDPNNNDHVIVTVGGYTNDIHVLKSTNATSANPTFTSIQGDLPYMPVYSAVIDVHNPDHIIIGTEFGVWTTTNGISWKLQEGMPMIPCHMLRQQYLPGVNKGVIYVGTHGRGIFKSGNTSSIIDFAENQEQTVDKLAVYPNPAQSFISFDLPQDVNEYTIKVIDLMGREVINESVSKQKSFDISSLEPGNYLAIVEYDGKKQVGKFIKNK